MSNPLSVIWVHAVWTTKNKETILTREIEKIVFDYMKKQFIEMKCRLGIINGTSDHVHCLFTLCTDKSLADVIQKVKGATSYYINDNDFSSEKFLWEKDYIAHTVGFKEVEFYREFIRTQKEYHKIRTYEEEYERILKPEETEIFEELYAKYLK